MASISTAAPQFLVSELPSAIAFYIERLGFKCDFVYDDFYASVSRDGATIHLKCAAKSNGEREHRMAGEHLDAFLPVSGIDELHQEFVDRETPIAKKLEDRPWGARDFYVEDPDGYILCFSESSQEVV